MVFYTNVQFGVRVLQVSTTVTKSERIKHVFFIRHGYVWSSQRGLVKQFQSHFRKMLREDGIKSLTEKHWPLLVEKRFTCKPDWNQTQTTVM